MRLMFNHAKVDFEDIRFDYGEWFSLKEQDPYKKFGVIPLLEIDGKVMSETSAIARYIARKYGYYPDDIDSQYEVDTVTSSIDHCMYMGAKAFWILKGDEKKKAVQDLREGEVR